jgi:hypothetical protein
VYFHVGRKRRDENRESDFTENPLLHGIAWHPGIAYSYSIACYFTSYLLTFGVPFIPLSPFHSIMM